MALSICMETDLMKVMIDAASSAILFLALGLTENFCEFGNDGEQVADVMLCFLMLIKVA